MLSSTIVSRYWEVIWVSIVLTLPILSTSAIQYRTVPPLLGMLSSIHDMDCG